MSLRAAKPVVRWAARTTAKEITHHAILVALVSTAVAIIGFAALVASVFQVSTSERFGSATHRIFLNGATVEQVTTQIADAETAFPGAQTIRETAPMRLPGGAGEVTISDGLAGSVHGGRSLRVLEGRIPDAPTELALDRDTAAVLDRFGLETSLGGEFVLGGQSWAVVGLVEDPSDLKASIMLGGPGSVSLTNAAEVVVQAADLEVEKFVESELGIGWESFAATADAEQMPVLIVYLFTLLAFLVIGLLASAGFFVIHRRRSRQYATLSSLGASNRTLLAAMATTGIVLGSFGALLGAVLSVVLFIPLEGWVSEILGHTVSLGRADIGPLAVVVAVSVLSTTFAAAAPGRTLITAPSVRSVMQDHASKSPSQSSLAAGLLGLSFGGVGASTGSLTLVPLSAMVVVVSSLVLVPHALAIWRRATYSKRIAQRAIGSRLATAFVSAGATRTYAAMAALVITGTLALAVALVFGANEKTVSERPENLDPRMVLIRPADQNPVDPRPVDDSLLPIGQITNLGGVESVVTIFAAFDGETAVRIAERLDGPLREGTVPTSDALAWVAQPDLAAALGVTTSGLDPDSVLISSTGVPAAIGGWSHTENNRTIPEKAEFGPFGSIPSVLLTESGVAANGFDMNPVGWLAILEEPITEDLEKEIFRISSTLLNVETFVDESTPPALGLVGLLVGAAIALAVAGALIGMIRAESQRELSSLRALGVSGSLLRHTSAMSMAVVAGLTGLLAVAPALLILMSVSLGSEDIKFYVDWSVLASYVVGLPVLCYVFGALVASVRSQTHRMLLD